jgi:hypothetical protein
VETGVGVKPTRAQVGIAVVVVASSSTNTKLMAVGVDKNAVSRARGDGAEDVTTPRLAWLPPRGRGVDGDARGGGASPAGSRRSRGLKAMAWTLS